MSELVKPRTDELKQSLGRVRNVSELVLHILSLASYLFLVYSYQLLQWTLSNLCSFIQRVNILLHGVRQIHKLLSSKLNA